MVKTYGLTHISLAVADPERSMRFYHDVFGAQEYYRDQECIQAKGPGHDIFAFVRDPDGAGRSGGIGHFGFRLIAPNDIDAAVDAALAAGGKLLERGEHGPGFPFAYIADPDGYQVEIWFE
jgi:catechol 2,3-dioxygenase-like lactoylglutathione lyase family enzyme